jgi:hypothetical protein
MSNRGRGFLWESGWMCMQLSNEEQVRSWCSRQRMNERQTCEACSGLFRRAQAVNNPTMVISRRMSQVVMQSRASYQRTQDAVALLTIVLQAEQSVTANRGSSTKKVAARLRARVKAR